MKKKLNALLLFAMFFCGSAMAGEKDDMFNPLQTAVPSLSIAPDARGGALGDVGAATSADVNSQYWNPAKYAAMDGRGGVSISYTPWLRKIVNDIDLVYLAGYYKLDEVSALSASFRYFSYGEINLTDLHPSGEPVEVGTAKPYEFAVDLGYSRALSERWTAAVALRFILSDITNGMDDEDGTYTSGKAVGADVAAYYKAPISLGEKRTANASFGFNISNIGSKISYDDGETSQFIPTNLRVGGAFEYPFDEYNSVTVALDLNKLLIPSTPVKTAEMTKEEYEEELQEYRDMSSVSGIFKSFGDAPGGFEEEMKEIMWSVGLEYSYNKQFMVRGGYFHESESKGNRKYFSLGAGFKLSVFELNAAYLISTAQSNPLDQTLRFSLGFNLEGMKKLVEN